MISEAVIDSINWHDVGVLSGSGGDLANSLRSFVRAKSDADLAGLWDELEGVAFAQNTIHGSAAPVVDVMLALLADRPEPWHGAWAVGVVRFIVTGGSATTPSLVQECQHRAWAGRWLLAAEAGRTDDTDYRDALLELLDVIDPGLSKVVAAASGGRPGARSCSSGSPAVRGLRQEIPERSVYRPEDLLHRVDGLAWLRENITRFLVSGYDRVALMGWLADEAFRLTGGSVSLRESEGWLLLESSVDWLCAWHDPFHQLHPLPALGPNNVSLVPALVVFEESVCTWESHRWVVVKGSACPSDPLASTVSRGIAIPSAEERST